MEIWIESGVSQTQESRDMFQKIQ